MLPHISTYFAANQLPEAEFTYRIHSPGRINLIGEHTDYTGGLVMPAAIDKGIEYYARPISTRELRLHAVDLGATYTLPLPVTGKTGELWVDYLAGITTQFQNMGYEIPGLEIVFGGDVPRGSGMSSSAALEGGMAFLLNELCQAGLTRPLLAQTCKASSNNFIGIPSGIMDQFASINGTSAGPIMLNCESLQFSTINANLPGYSWLLVNSMVSHELTGSEYPDRVAQCQEALTHLQQHFPTLDYLSAASPAQLEKAIGAMPPIVQKRARHVVHENERVRQAAKALEQGDAAKMGQLMQATHASLRDEFEVSCEEVDFLQAEAITQFPAAVAGSRIMGGGFGGCTINLLKTVAVPDLKTYLTEVYREKYDLAPEFYDVVISDGTRMI
ncbi:MAG: galactokinase [Bacteroidota bacterium]